MITNEINADKLYLPLVQEKMNNSQIIQKGDETFTDALKGFVADVNNQQIESKNATESFIKGEPVDIHDVMITVEKAKTSFELLMELRNKGLDLYREVLRMQI
ncbi:MAG TPA: flagellar hook-basal body complex protein FliE [Bacteroidota bacterium]|nr:flagellar hook-basal body complex protein FliE [Bacteroidota bacterium]